MILKLKIVEKYKINTSYSQTYSTMTTLAIIICIDTTILLL